MRRFLVVYYSYQGASRILAKTLCGQQGWPHAEVRELSLRNGWRGTLRCWIDSLLRRTPIAYCTERNLSQYDCIVLIAPTWAFRLASPMRSFIAQNRYQLRDVALISVSSAYGAMNAIAEVSYLLDHAPSLCLNVSPKDVNDGFFSRRLMAFSQTLKEMPAPDRRMTQNSGEFEPSFAQVQS